MAKCAIDTLPRPLASCREGTIKLKKGADNIEKATVILKELLVDSPMPIDTIFADCDANGIGDRTVRRAAKEIGVISRSTNGVTT